MNVNAMNSSDPSLYEICGSIEYVTLNCQVGSPFFQDPNEVNYVQNFNPRPTNDPYSNIYNPGWKNHSNCSYRSRPNPSNVPHMNARPTPHFQKPLFLLRCPKSLI